jgi:outer membrane protein assembly factor BamB
VYVGSADRRFYALAPDGSERWSFATGDIVDSSGLLDDRGRLYPSVAKNEGGMWLRGPLGSAGLKPP